MSNQHQSLCTCGCCEGADNLTPLELANMPGLSALHYRVGTHSNFKQSMLLALSHKQALSKLTSRNDDDMAVSTLDAWASVLDVLTFYQERIINEGFLRTATERRSVLELARHISYTLAPGVAASTYLAFNVNEAPGASTSAVIPVGTKVQSIPGQDQLPQLFETVSEIEAMVEWNALKVETKRRTIPVYNDKEIYLKGINTGLQPGDGILMIGDERKDDTKNENWDFRKVKRVVTDTENDYTKVTWERGLGKFSHNVKVVPANKNFKVYALRQRAFLFGYNAPDWRNMSKETRNRYLGLPGNAPDSDANLDTEWKNFTISSISSPETDTIHLDNIYAKIINNSWVVLTREDYDEVYRVDNAAESSRKNFTLTSKTTALKLSGENLVDEFDTHVRNSVLFGQSEELELAERPVPDFLKNGQEITLEKLMTGLPVGKQIILTGKRRRLQIVESGNYPHFIVTDNALATRQLTAGDSLIIIKAPETLADDKFRWTLMDDNGNVGTMLARSTRYVMVASETRDTTVSELHVIKSLKPGTDPTVIVLQDLVYNVFDPPTVTICANVADSTHGETRHETLGSGNGSQVFQKFELKQHPMTFISASTASGTQTTLEVRVNDILWKEVSTFYGAGPKDQVYVTTINDDSKVTVQFGDGITGARLPTGTENITATYRVGIGSAGLLNAGQLSMLMTPILGINKVINPLDTTGAEDPEQIDDARQNAPLTVLTLDRIVSAKDFEDYTRAFAGIGKARADILWKGEQQLVYITVAASDEGPVDKQSKQYENLLLAIKGAGHTNNVIYVENFKALFFSVQAGIKVDERYKFETVKENVILALKDKFSFAKRDFGQDVTPAEVMATIQGVEGVIYTDLDHLNGSNPFGSAHFRIQAGLAHRVNETLFPAELLVINPDEIIITQITE
ncbi:MAG: putative baseplate assembly protein [Ferruginibacter sp.]